MGLMDMLGNLNEFEAMGKALVKFQQDTLDALARIEHNQAMILQRLDAQTIKEESENA